MAHFAKLDGNNIVLRVIVVSNDDALAEAYVPRPTDADCVWNEITQTWDNRE